MFVKNEKAAPDIHWRFSKVQKLPVQVEILALYVGENDLTKLKTGPKMNMWIKWKKSRRHCLKVFNFEKSWTGGTWKKWKQALC